jgi:hypothetical protein
MRSFFGKDAYFVDANRYRIYGTGKESTMLRNILQHYLSPVHVYCRLVDCRIPRKKARWLAGLYEKRLYRWVLAR